MSGVVLGGGVILRGLTLTWGATTAGRLWLGGECAAGADECPVSEAGDVGACPGGEAGEAGDDEGDDDETLAAAGGAGGAASACGGATSTGGEAAAFAAESTSGGSGAFERAVRYQARAPMVAAMVATHMPAPKAWAGCKRRRLRRRGAADWGGAADHDTLTPDEEPGSFVGGGGSSELGIIRSPRFMRVRTTDTVRSTEARALRGAKGSRSMASSATLW
jgi:hypothetical protein